MAEAGFPDVDIGLWVGIFAVGGGPADVVTTLDAALRTAINDPQVQSKLRAVGVVPVALHWTGLQN